MSSKKSINKSQRLFIELGTSLGLECGTTPGTAISSELIGMRVGSYLIVRLSRSSPDIGTPGSDEKLLVKYLGSGEVFGFTTRVILRLDQPDRLLFLEYPETVNSFNVRAHERTECFLPVEVSLGGATFRGMVTNINFQGCLCIMDNYSAPDPSEEEAIEVHFPLDSNTPLSLRGEIRSIGKKPSRISLGIRFAALDSFAESVLATLVPSLGR